MKIQELNDKNLLSEIKNLALKERKIGLDILKFICEIERRKCYIDLGYASLFVYLTQELCYSESDAYKRIVSAKLLKEFPVLAEKIETGKISSTNLTIIATTLKKHQVNDKSKKLEIIEKNENKSKRELQKSLFELFGSESSPEEVIKQVSKDELSLSITISEELLKKMNRLKALKNISKILSTAELLETLVDKELEQENKKLKKNNAVILEPEKVILQQSRSVPTQVKRVVWKRAKGMCEWIDPISKKSCGSLFFLQYDHIYPFAWNGNSNLENIQLLCANHNLRRGIKSFSLNKMKR